MFYFHLRLLIIIMISFPTIRNKSTDWIRIFQDSDSTVSIFWNSIPRQKYREMKLDYTSA